MTPEDRSGLAPDAAEREQALAELLRAVEDHPDAFDFYALMRRIDTLRPELPRTGEALRPRQEALRLGQAPELDFAPAPLAALQPQNGAPPRLLVRFFGLLGPMGPMPLHLTEFVRDRLRHHDDPTLAHFLDLFHHRMLSLFYRAWAQTQPVVQLDRPEHDRFRVWLGALSGALSSGATRAAGAGQATGAGGVTPEMLAFHAGWLADRSAHPEMLRKVLAQVLGVPVRVEEHVAHWLVMAPEDRTRLGHARNRPERSARPPAQLGRNANAGSRVWDRQFRFRVHLGPLSLAQYRRFLPGTPDWTTLNAAVRHFAGRSCEWDLALHLDPAERPPPQLRQRPQLGVLAWSGRATAPASGGLRLRQGRSFLARNVSRPGAPDA
jgi:type VI secretion system protein ImpH